MWPLSQIWREFSFIFYGGHLYLAQWYTDVTDLTLGTTVICTYNLSMVRNANSVFISCWRVLNLCTLIAFRVLINYNKCLGIRLWSWSQNFLKSVLRLVTLTPFSLFDWGCSYYAQGLFMVFIFKQKFQIAHMTLESNVKVTCSWSLSAAGNANYSHLSTVHIWYNACLWCVDYKEHSRLLLWP